MVLGGGGTCAVLAVDIFLFFLQRLEFADQFVDVGVGALVVDLLGDGGRFADVSCGAFEVGLRVGGVGSDAFEGVAGGVEGS